MHIISVCLIISYYIPATSTPGPPDHKDKKNKLTVCQRLLQHYHFYYTFIWIRDSYMWVGQNCFEFGKVDQGQHLEDWNYWQVYPMQKRSTYKRILDQPLDRTGVCRELRDSSDTGGCAFKGYSWGSQSINILRCNVTDSIETLEVGFPSISNDIACILMIYQLNGL